MPRKLMLKEDLLIISKLVRMSVFGTEEDIPVGLDWPGLFAAAGVNGVSAISYEAVKRLDTEYQPDFDLLLQWDISVQGLIEGYKYRQAVTQDLLRVLERNGISMLLLKGATLAANYPQPCLRESGDVDFIALPDFDACNAVIESLGIQLEFQNKHSSFAYKGVHFENHTVEPTDGYNRVHHRTYALIKESLPNAVHRKDGSLELPPVIQAVFVVKHTAQHLCYSGGRIALRMLLDLALLLRRYPEILNVWECELRTVGLQRFSEIMLCATDQLLGTEFRDDWSSWTCRRANRFINLFLTDSNRAVRYFAKFTFLPLQPVEVLRICCEKVRTLLRKIIKNKSSVKNRIKP